MRDSLRFPRVALSTRPSKAGGVKSHSCGKHDTATLRDRPHECPDFAFLTLMQRVRILVCVNVC
jgi:hypothetical protein